MTKQFIKNRKEQKLAVVVEQPQGQVIGLAFVMHGLGGFKEQPQIRTVAETFLANGYTTVTFDTTNTLGESDGNYENATLSNYYEDLGDVIQWAKKKDWYSEPFILSGHSFGGFCTAYYAENNPYEVKAVAPISATVSGKLSIELHDPKKLEEWRTTGWMIEKSVSRPGVIKKLKWQPHEADRLKYDLLPRASRLTMPVLLVIGSNDRLFPHEKLLFEKLPGEKKFIIIEGSDHNFRSPDELTRLKEIFDKWIKSIN